MSESPDVRATGLLPRLRSIVRWPLRLAHKDGPPALATLVCAALFIAALCGTAITPFSETHIDFESVMLPPAWEAEGAILHPLGTDQLGRDVLSRLVAGAQVSLLVAGAAVIFGGVLGTFVGLIAGYFGGVTGALLNFVMLARIAGVSRVMIALRHVLPNAFNSVAILAVLDVGRAMMLESALSFLGLGVQPPSVSWGVMLADAKSFMGFAWWLALFPGLVIFLSVLSFSALGDWLQSRLDPRSGL